MEHIDTSGADWAFRILNQANCNTFIDEFECYKVEHPESLMAVIANDEFYSINGITGLEFPGDACDTCNWVVDSAGSLIVEFTDIDTTCTLLLSVPAIASFYEGYENTPDSSRMLTVTAYDPDDQEYDTLETVPPRMMSDFAYIYLSQDYNNSGAVTIKLYWAEKYPYAGFAIFKASQSGMDIDTLSISEVIKNGTDTLSSALINSLDSTGVYLDGVEFVDFRYTYSAASASYTQTFFLDVDGFTQQYAVNADTLEATVNITTDDITIEEFNSATAVSGAFIFIDNGTTQESGFTDGSGVFNPTADLDYTYDIYVYKIGYRPLKVQHSGTPIYDNEIWYSDIQLQGDVVAEAGDTLTILPGTGVWVKHTSAVWNYAYDLNSRVDIMAYGGHIQAFGTEDDPVIFRPTPGGSGLYQWAGILAKNGGSFDINWATIEYVDAVAGIQGGTGPGNCKLVHTRHIGNQGVYGDWRSSSAQDGWFQADTCYVEGRFMFLRNADSCWARACTLSASSSAHECFYVDNCSSTVTFDACSLYSYTSQGGRNMSDGKSNFIDCAFKGTAKAISQYGQLELNSSRIDAGNTSYGLYEANTSSEIISRNTIFENYSSGGVLLRSANDFGTLENPGHNCFLDSSAQNEYAIYNDTKESIDAEWNYFAWKRFACPPTVSADSTDEWCDPDSTKTPKIIVKKDVIVPREFALGNAVPNPFNSTVAIEFDVPKEAEVKLEVFNLLGKKVITLKNEELSAGRYRVLWDSRDASGHEMPSGTYLYRMRSGDEFEETKKMILIK